eukprot:TRINITY_DN674_c0_g1_i1.p1 TRINITY_DN674_c0_g1~~TRINITY_DN674_c0_g1_i1.p1  ORF type:complete len:231 (-),score=38.61 TRINITY_DN674_c0_g1_i1:168-860(-)
MAEDAAAHNFLTELAPELFVLLCGWLNPDDLEELSRTSLSVRTRMSQLRDPIWCSLIERVCGVECLEADDSVSRRELFSKLMLTTLPILTGWVCHLGDQYWVRRRVANSVSSGEVAYLRSVCWLQVEHATTLLPGRYEVSWRMMLETRFSADAIAMLTDVEEGCGSCDDSPLQWTQEMRQQTPPNEWFELKVAEVRVTSKAAVRFRMHLFSDASWKSGLTIDCIRCRRLL